MKIWQLCLQGENVLVYKDGGKSDVRSLLVTRPTKKEDTAVIEFTVDGKYKHKVARFVYFIFNQSRNGIILNFNVKHVFLEATTCFMRHAFYCYQVTIVDLPMEELSDSVQSLTISHTGLL